MLFLKCFDASQQKLLGAGKYYMPRSQKVSDLIPIVNERMRWPSGTPLKLYEVKLNSRVFFQRCSNPLEGNQTWNDRDHEAETLFCSE